MAGYEEAGPSRRLLAEYGFEVGDTLFGTGAILDGEPKFMRFFKSPYVPLPDGQYAHVRFQVAWPLINHGPKEGYRIFALGPTLKGDMPIIAARQEGRGVFVAIGDTFFAMNRNLERMDGAPIEGMRENAEFWRWLLGELTGAESVFADKQAGHPAGGGSGGGGRCDADTWAAGRSGGGRAVRRIERGGPAMKRAWIATALLATSWLVLLGYYHQPDAVLGYLLVGAGVVLLGGILAREGRGEKNSTALALAADSCGGTGAGAAGGGDRALAVQGGTPAAGDGAGGRGDPRAGGGSVAAVVTRGTVAGRRAGSSGDGPAGAGAGGNGVRGTDGPQPRVYLGW